MWNYLKLVLLGLVTLFAAIAANYARDLAYMVHAIIVMLVAGGFFLWALRRTDEYDVPTDNSLSYMDGRDPRRRHRHRLLGRGRLPGRGSSSPSSWPSRSSTSTGPRAT